jgi:5-(carboxyamino)imidazole ribonucleotide synthase
MLAQAASKLGFHVHIYSPDEDIPAAEVAGTLTRAAYDDHGALTEFAASVDVITYEFENVPAPTAAFLNARKPVRPTPSALAVTQDRLTEKEFLKDCGIPLTAFALIRGPDQLEGAIESVGLPAVLKTRRLGYDGKGQTVVESLAHARAAFQSFGGAEIIAEGFVDFSDEISIIAARDLMGGTALYEAIRNEHHAHILYRSHVPAGIPAELAEHARRIGELLLKKLDYVGVMGIEFFVETETGRRRLLVNEIAPRVHNSGHWTMDACQISQFEQHIRAICGWPLGPTARHADAVMQNLLGEDIDGWQEYLAEPNLALHVYGKSEARPGRKMGHFTRLYPLTKR